ncbi:hypothetical protein [Natranaeroarchaeum aerophilus]|uniref:Uncharacterized protein n=1 Tax=Natranaeroarchaeum aerophilus TaxID=2917711 RepID=A0AAE3K6I1_9EURY|nr:hypothetical protein [Natranaeroarchaeum aerophilus]MCL9814435.1 hypothetical protein [Natranaeroarchaeum aerophilus]
MNRRSLSIAAIALLAVVCLGMVAAVAFPLSTGEPQGMSESFTQHADEEYQLSGEIETDGDVSLAVDGAVAESGEGYVRIVDNSVTDTRYQDGDDETVYRQLLIEDAGPDQPGADRYIEDIEDDPDERLVRENRAGETTELVTVVEDPDTEIGDRLDGGASVVTEVLGFAEYDSVETSDGTQTLTPTDGWFDEYRSYRIAGSSGDVRVDAETNAVEQADVRWDVTTDAGSYAEYLIAGETTTQRISYEYEGGDVDVETPEWVDGIDA